MEFVWKIEDIARRPEDGFVTTVFYRVTARDGNLVAEVYGGMDMQPGETFTPFKQLTERDVISWVQHALDKNTVEDSLRTRIESQRVPPVLHGLPWEK